MKNILTTLIVAFLLSGCASKINEKMESWMGHHKNDLIASWGPPQDIMDDGQGGEIFIYSNERTYTTPGTSTTNTYGSASAFGNTAYGSATSTTHHTPAQTSGYTAQRMFWIDGRGIIYRWSWKGL